jgi:hypothetical protein
LGMMSYHPVKSASAKGEIVVFCVVFCVVIVLFCALALSRIALNRGPYAHRKIMEVLSLWGGPEAVAAARAGDTVSVQRAVMAQQSRRGARASDDLPPHVRSTLLRYTDFHQRAQQRMQHSNPAISEDMVWESARPRKQHTASSLSQGNLTSLMHHWAPSCLLRCHHRC